MLLETIRFVSLVEELLEDEVLTGTLDLALGQLLSSVEEESLELRSKRFGLVLEIFKLSSSDVSLESLVSKLYFCGRCYPCTSLLFWYFRRNILLIG